jgi:hypothetical protein
MSEHAHGVNIKGCYPIDELLELEARNRALVEALERLVEYAEEDNPGRAIADAETAGLLDAARAVLKGEPQ